MTTRTRFAVLASLLVVGALAGLAGAQEVDPDDFSHPVRCELNAARMEAGLVRSTVVYDRRAKAWRIETDPSERLRQAEADALCAAVCAEAALGPLVVDPATVEDALVVLRFEPGHAKAQQLVRARYESLRTAARTKRAGGGR